MKPVELAEQLFAPFGQTSRSDHLYRYIVVADPPSAEVRDTLALELELLPALRAWRDGECHHAVYRGNFYFVAERGLLCCHVRFGIEIIALALKVEVRPHPRYDLDVSRRPAPLSWFAHARNPDL